MLRGYGTLRLDILPGVPRGAPVVHEAIDVTRVQVVLAILLEEARIILSIAGQRLRIFVFPALGTGTLGLPNVLPVPFEARKVALTHVAPHAVGTNQVGVVFRVADVPSRSFLGDNVWGYLAAFAMINLCCIRCGRISMSPMLCDCGRVRRSCRSTSRR